MKKRLIFKLLLPALSALLLSACDRVETPAAVRSDEIVFVQDGLDVEVGQTRAAAVTAADLDAGTIYVTAVTGAAGSESADWSNVAFTYSDGIFAGGKFWANSNPGYRFYGSNVSVTPSAAGPTVSASNGTDVVCAYNSAPVYKQTNTLQFKHIFARLGDVTVTAASGYTVSNVSITLTPKVSGTYNLRTGSGYTDGTGWSSTSNGSAVNIAPSSPGTKSNDIWLVPGEYTVTASWRVTGGGGAYDETFSNITYGIYLTAGKINTINVSFTGDASWIEFTIGVTDWSSTTLNFGSYPA